MNIHDRRQTAGWIIDIGQSHTKYDHLLVKYFKAMYPPRIIYKLLHPLLNPFIIGATINQSNILFLQSMPPGCMSLVKDKYWTRHVWMEDNLFVSRLDEATEL